jgi:hypothetical protein
MIDASVLIEHERGGSTWTRTSRAPATALAHGLSLATANVREFGRVAGLHVEDWTRR